MLSMSWRVNFDLHASSYYLTHFAIFFSSVFDSKGYIHHNLSYAKVSVLVIAFYNIHPNTNNL